MNKNFKIYHTLIESSYLACSIKEQD